MRGESRDGPHAVPTPSTGVSLRGLEDARDSCDGGSMSNRPTCGTRWGAAEHAKAEEALCGTCIAFDDACHLAHENRMAAPAPYIAPTHRQAVARALEADIRSVVALLALLMEEAA